MMEAASTYETLVNIYQTTQWRYNPEGAIFFSLLLCASKVLDPVWEFGSIMNVTTNFVIDQSSSVRGEIKEIDTG
jgi:hypothetical protein